MYLKLMILKPKVKELKRLVTEKNLIGVIISNISAVTDPILMKLSSQVPGNI